MKSLEIKTITLTAGNGALGTRKDITLSGRGRRLLATMKNEDSTNPLTGFAYYRRSATDGDWKTVLSGTDWTDPSLLKPGEESGTDGTNGHFVYQLAAGESCQIALDVDGADAVGFAAQAGAAGVAVSIKSRVSLGD